MNQSVCLQPCILIIDSVLCNLVAVFLVYKFMHRNSFVHIVSYRHWVSYWKFKDKEEQKMNSLGITLRFPKYHT